jgi:phosphopantothenoylcysteine decarboxylase/phosphopantothenate--cysteine ligase
VEISQKKLNRARGPLELRLEPNADILKELGESKNGKWLVGFAAETEDLVANASKKLRDKRLDMIVANNVAEEGSGFDGDTNKATILDRNGVAESLPLMTKDELADRIFDHLLALKSGR